MQRQTQDKDVGRRLREMRLQRRMSLETVAEKVAMQPQDLALIERGEFDGFNAALLGALARAFDVRPLALLTDPKQVPSAEESASREAAQRRELLEKLPSEAAEAVKASESDRGREVGNDVLRALAELGHPSDLRGTESWSKLLRSLLGYAF